MGCCCSNPNINKERCDCGCGRTFDYSHDSTIRSLHRDFNVGKLTLESQKPEIIKTKTAIKEE